MRNYFGREEETPLFLSKLEKGSTLFFYGISGVGKTEFIQKTLSHFNDTKIHYISCVQNVNEQELVNNIINKLPFKLQDDLSVESNIQYILQKLIKEKIFLIIDDFHHLENIFNSLFVSFFLTKFRNINSESKIILVTNKFPKLKNGIDFLECPIMKLGGLNRDSVQEMIKELISLHCESNISSNIAPNISADELAKMAELSYGIPQFIKFIVNLIVTKKYPISQIVDESFLSLEETVDFVSKNYLASIDENQINFLYFLSSFRIPVKKTIIENIFGINKVSIQDLIDELLIDNLEWDKISLAPLISSYLKINISEIQKTNFHNLALKYYEKLDKKDSKSGQIIGEILNHKLMIKDYGGAFKFYSLKYRKLIENGEIELAKSILNELERVGVELPFSLKLAKAEILSICLNRNESLLLCEYLENSAEGTRNLDLKLLHARLLNKLGNLKGSKKKLSTIIKLINSGRQNYTTSYNANELMVLSLAEMSKIYMIREQYSKALTELKKAENIATSNDLRPTDKATIYFHLASLFFSRGDFQVALEYREKANTIFIKEGMQENIAISYFNIALIHYHLTNFERSFEYLEKSEKVCKNFGYDFILAGVYHLYGLYYFRRGEFDRALDHFFLTDKLIAHLTNNIQTKRNRLWISNTYRMKSDLDRAEKFLLTEHENESTILAIESLTQSGLVALDKRQLEEATKYFRQVELFSAENKNRINLIVANLAISEFNIYLGKYQHALNYAKKAYKIGKKSNIILYTQDSRQLISESLYHLNKLNDSKKVINVATKYHRKFQSNYELIKDLIILARINSKEKNYSSSLRLLFEAIKLADQNGYFEKIAQLKIEIAICYLDISKYPHAFEYGLKSLKLATRKSFAKYISASYLIFKKLHSSSFKLDFNELSIEMEIRSINDIDFLFDKYYSRLDSGDKLWIKNLGLDNVKENIFKYTQYTKAGTSSFDEAQYLQLINDPNKKYHIIVDTVTAVVYEREVGKIDFSSRSMLMPLLEFLILNKGKVFSKEDLIREVWHGKYNPLSHDNVIYTSINRLRNLIEAKKDKFKYVKSIGNGYFFDPITDYCMIKRFIKLEEDLNFRQKWVLEYLMTEPMITNKEYSVKFNINRTTTFLELNSLVLKNFLERTGKGRSTHYSTKK